MSGKQETCRTRPRATLHMATDNVAHGRGQRCTRPCATLHPDSANKYVTGRHGEVYGRNKCKSLTDRFVSLHYFLRVPCSTTTYSMEHLPRCTKCLARCSSARHTCHRPPLHGQLRARAPAAWVAAEHPSLLHALTRCRLCFCPWPCRGAPRCGGLEAPVCNGRRHGRKPPAHRVSYPSMCAVDYLRSVSWGSSKALTVWMYLGMKSAMVG